MQLSFFMNRVQHSLIVLCLEINCVTVVWMIFYCHPHYMHVIHTKGYELRSEEDRDRRKTTPTTKSLNTDVTRSTSIQQTFSKSKLVHAHYHGQVLVVYLTLCRQDGLFLLMLRWDFHTKIWVTRFKLYYFLIYNKIYNLHQISLYITQFCFIKSVCKLYI